MKIDYEKFSKTYESLLTSRLAGQITQDEFEIALGANRATYYDQENGNRPICTKCATDFEIHGIPITDAKPVCQICGKLVAEVARVLF
jgi:hypothetical protein